MCVVYKYVSGGGRGASSICVQVINISYGRILPKPGLSVRDNCKLGHSRNKVGQSVLKSDAFFINH